MPFSLIGHMRDLVTQARAASAGFWPSETVVSGTAARPAGVANLENKVIFPKLYRRPVAYFTDNHTDLSPHPTPGSAPNPTATTPPNFPAATVMLTVMPSRTGSPVADSHRVDVERGGPRRPTGPDLRGAGGARTHDRRIMSPLL